MDVELVLRAATRLDRISAMIARNGGSTVVLAQTANLLRTLAIDSPWITEGIGEHANVLAQTIMDITGDLYE